MTREIRFCICNEIFEGWKFADACKAAARTGYGAIEIAPFTLAESPGAVTSEMRRECRDAMRGEGLTFAGLHWLMVGPKGLHVTAADRELRERSWRHVAELVELCGDLAEGQSTRPVMVFGSPKQRCTTPGVDVREAVRHFIEGMSGIAGRARERDLTVLVEALPANQCDVIQTLEEAVAVVKAVDSPAVRTMFDSHNAVDEREPHAALIDRHFDMIRHVHVNETDGRYPGTGDYDFVPVFEVLRRRGYAGLVSVEVFDFSPGAEKIASESLRYLQGEIAKLA